MSLLSEEPLITFIFASIFLYVTHLTLSRFRRAVTGDNDRYNNSSGEGPKNYPIIGCLVSFYKNRRRLLEWYTKLLSESKTNTIVVRRFGARRTIVTANPANVEYILKTNFDNYPKGSPFTEILGDFLGLGIFNVDGDLWRAQRKLVSHEFAAKSLRDYAGAALEEEVGAELLPLMGSLVAGDSAGAVDLQDLLRRFAFNVICKVSLGIERWCLDPSSPVNPLAEAFDAASAICAGRGAAPLLSVWKLKRRLGVGSERRLRAAAGEVRRHVSEIIRRRRRRARSGEDLLTRLIAAGHDEEVIRDMVISFIMAGRDTTSAAMTWLFWSLTCHPEVERRVVEEIEAHCSDKKLDYESLKELKLLEACICESMRLYPPVVWDSKHAVEDDFLPDKTRVIAGDRVTYFPYGMGRMESLWGKDRLEFKPERWFLEPEKLERGSLKKVCPYKFPVFQAGPRVCLGKEMAFVQMKFVVASILRRFEIRPVGAEPPVFVPLLTAHMAGGFKVSVSKRRKD